MTAKQLAQRLGVDIRQLDFRLDAPCKDCKKLGGTNKPCDECMVIAVVELKGREI
jgi:hypothetical protein